MTDKFEISRTAQNAVIKHTSLGSEAFGIRTFWLNLEFEGSGQGAGGYELTDSKFTAFLIELLNVLEVQTWESLPGTYCRVERDKLKVYSIGHPIKDKWVDLVSIFEDQ